MSLDAFWQHIADQREKLNTAKTVEEVIAILDPPSSGDAFFAGSGDGDSIAYNLEAAGWRWVWADADYYWVMREPSPGRGLLTYVEGDVYRGDQSVRS